MTPHSLTDLIERVEAARGPDRELDALICQMVDLPCCIEPDCLPDVLRAAIAYTLDGSWPHDTDSVPDYTASLDAALTLVADDCTWLRLSPATMTVSRPDPNEKRWAKHFEAQAATPALALCAAALKARARTPDEKDQTNVA